jgi:atrial natriuretic peptide receptor A
MPPPSASSSVSGTQKGDVYSFAIIVQEILYRKGVFYLNEEDKAHYFLKNNDDHYDNFIDYNVKIAYKDLFDNVKKGLRPSIDNHICFKEIADLIRKCWSEAAYDRPDFTVIRDVMRKTTK